MALEVVSQWSVDGSVIGWVLQPLVIGHFQMFSLLGEVQTVVKMLSQ